MLSSGRSIGDARGRAAPPFDLAGRELAYTTREHRAGRVRLVMLEAYPMSSTKGQLEPSNGSTPLAGVATRDLVVLAYIVRLGISRLRWRIPGVDDIDLLRAELARREAGAAA